MTRIHMLTGSLSILIGSVMVVCSVPIDINSDLEIMAPKIEDMGYSSKGKACCITCTVYPGVLRDETVVYWLANDTFVETAYKNDRVQTKQSVVGNERIETTLTFNKVLKEDFQTKFTCVALNPAGYDRRTTELKCSK